MAEQLNDPASLARIQYDLALVHARQGNHEAALDYAQKARQTYQQLGDRFSQEKLNNFLTALYLNMKAFDRVVATGEPTLRFFERAKLDYWASMTAANIAEAQYELKDYDLAEQRARQVLALEEVHSRNVNHLLRYVYRHGGKACTHCLVAHANGDKRIWISLGNQLLHLPHLRPRYRT